MNKFDAAALFYKALIEPNFNVTTVENIKKLEARYPNGCFEAAKSINRKEGDI